MAGSHWLRFGRFRRHPSRQKYAKHPENAPSNETGGEVYPSPVVARDAGGHGWVYFCSQDGTIHALDAWPEGYLLEGRLWR